MHEVPMDQLHTAFNETIRKKTTPARIVAAIVTAKLRAKGIKCSKERSRAIGERIAEHLRSATVSKGASTILFSDGKKRGRKFHLELTAEDVERYLKDLGDGLGRQVLPLVQKPARRYLSTVRRPDYIGMHVRRADLERFRVNLRKRWGSSFDSYERLLAVAIDAGGAANAYLRSGRAGKPGALVDAMSRIHARACNVAGEVLTLLEAGYADGAHARWRTLHELEVVAAMLSEHDDDLAERYLLHEIVESLRAARQLQECASGIGERPPSKRELENLISLEKQLQERFGAEYRTPYGWAAKLLNNPNPNFSHLEKAANLDHLRPYYKLASYNVHATPKGATYRLGLLGSSKDILLAGPSNAGLEEAGRFAAHSLLTITLCVLTIQPTLDSLVYGQMLVHLYDDTERRFLRAAAKLEADESRLSRRVKAAGS